MEAYAYHEPALLFIVLLYATLVGDVPSGGLRVLKLLRLGIVGYAKNLHLQERLIRRRRLCNTDVLVCLQHPPAFTLGKRHTIHNLISSPEVLNALGAELHTIDRGGDITFHGPGQAALYPIIGLRDLRIGPRKYAEGLEDTMIKVAAMHGINAQGRIPGQSGVWISNRKIGAVEVRISNGGITSHGLAFNINPDLEFFSYIVPCGIHDKEVTSLAKELNVISLDYETVLDQLIQSFAEVFGYEVESMGDDELVELFKRCS